MSSKIIISLLFICIYSQKIVPILDLVGNISSLNIPITEENYYETIIDSLIELMDYYAYINILKSPPEVNGSAYFKKVDVIQDLKNLRENVTQNTPNFYDFYQDIMKIIDSTMDYHILFGYVGQKEPFSLLNTMFVCSPIVYNIQNNKNVLVDVNSLVAVYSGGTIQVENAEIISANYKDGISVEKINGINIFDYIRDFCSDYAQFKSPSAKFVFNRVNLQRFSLWQCPLNPEYFNSFNITYSNGQTITSKFVGFNVIQKDVKNNENLINSLFDNYQFKKIYTEEISKFENNINNNVKWDINIDNKIKCKVDHDNQVNVVFQNSFNPDNTDQIGIINNISYCHGNFTNNDYPLIVIESLNPGGFAQLSKLMQQMVQDLYHPKNYFSVIHNNNTKEFLKINKESFMFVDDEEKHYLDIDEFYNEKVYEKYDNITIERSKQRLLKDLIFESKITGNIFKRKKIKKPTDVIIFTDGLSFSSTSVFIKNLYYFGGAILVGYGGDPESDLFDASQNPTFVLTNFTGIKGYNELLSRGFMFAQIPVGPMYKTRYDNNNDSIPEEFTVNYIDERINIYKDYSDNLYEDFISEAKKIFEKYKTNCNTNNKYMKLLNDKCKFSDEHMHGGYICGNDGNWTKTCAPFYCDEDYYFDYVNQKCILWNKDKGNDGGNDNLIYIIIFSILGGLIIIIILLFVLHKYKLINLTACFKKKDSDYMEVKES